MTVITWATVAAVLLVSAASLAADLKERVKAEVESVGLHPGMDPGMYVCALGHLHIKGSVHNLAEVPLGQIKVIGKAYEGQGRLLGTAESSTKPAVVQPGERAEINLEFLTVTGPLIRQVTRHEVRVTDALAKR